MARDFVGEKSRLLQTVVTNIIPGRRDTTPPTFPCHSSSITWDFFEYKGGLMENMEVEKAYKVALKTWARWIDRNVDPNKTTVFFRSVSPVHKSGNQWCYNQTQPNSEEIYGDSFPRRLTEVVEKQLRHMKTPVKYLNVTHLSRYRKDAHASVYTSRRGKLLTKEQQMHPKEHADCSHCLFQKEMTTKKPTPATASGVVFINIEEKTFRLGKHRDFDELFYSS
ncbi:hypothetical protein ACLOJK_010505 [Asimina triloba]